MSKFKQGIYTLRHPEKYIGDINNVTYRSSWEQRMHIFLDSNVNILRWASEEVPIKYVHPMDPPGKIRTYWPDYYVEYKKRDGTIAKEIIEIKPTKDTKRSNARNPKTKKIQDIVYLTNQAKWTYAQKFCEARGLKFNIMTEKELFR